MTRRGKGFGLSVKTAGAVWGDDYLRLYQSGDKRTPLTKRILSQTAECLVQCPLASGLFTHCKNSIEHVAWKRSSTQGGHCERQGRESSVPRQRESLREAERERGSHQLYSGPSPSLSEDVMMSVGTQESRSASMIPRGSS